MKRSVHVLFTLAVFACAGSPPPPAASLPASPAPVPSTPPAPAATASASSPLRAGKPVALPKDASGYLAAPSTPSKHPGVIVIHEFWGLNDRTRDDTDRLAIQGYVALAIDLYRGRSTSSADEAHELMRGLPEDRALGDLETAFEWLAARPDVDPARIGVIGWCMGGGYALALAVDQPKLRAAVVNYGRLVSASEKVAKVRAAFLGNFAGQDRGIPPADVRAFEKQLKTTLSDVDIKIYDSDGHAFMNPDNVKGYDEAAAKDAWARIDGFLARTLLGKSLAGK